MGRVSSATSAAIDEATDAVLDVGVPLLLESGIYVTDCALVLAEPSFWVKGDNEVISKGGGPADKTDPDVGVISEMKELETGPKDVPNAAGDSVLESRF